MSPLEIWALTEAVLVGEAGGLVLIEVAETAQGADAAGRIGGVVGAWQRRVDVAREKLVDAATERVAAADGAVFAEATIQGDAGLQDVR